MNSFWYLVEENECDKMDVLYGCGCMLPGCIFSSHLPKLHLTLQKERKEGRPVPLLILPDLTLKFSIF